MCLAPSFLGTVVWCLNFETLHMNVPFANWEPGNVNLSPENRPGCDSALVDEILQALKKRQRDRGDAGAVDQLQSQAQKIDSVQTVVHFFFVQCSNSMCVHNFRLLDSSLRLQNLLRLDRSWRP